MTKEQMGDILVADWIRDGASFPIAASTVYVCLHKIKRLEHELELVKDQYENYVRNTI